MAIATDMGNFASKKIVNWEIGDKIENPSENAYRISVGYDDDISWADKFHKFLDDENSSELEALVVGGWGEMGTGTASTEVVDAIVAASDRLPKLTAIFIAEVTFEECEISWIVQSDLSPLLLAFPALTHFGARGGAELSLGALRHEKLESLVIETGGLDRRVLQQIGNSKLPNLKHLEIWLGTTEYGANFAIGDIEPIVQSSKFPKLEYLGLRDSDMADAVAELLAKSDIVKQLRILDLSLGTLGDVGAEHLLNCPQITQLKKLDIHYHYCSDNMINKLRRLGIEIDSTDGQGDNEEDRYVSVGE